MDEPEATDPPPKKAARARAELVAKANALEAKPAPPKLPEVWDACFNLPLYRVIAQGDEAKAFAEKLAEERFEGDAYCVDCKRETPFKRWGLPMKDPVAVSLASMRSTPVKTPASLFQNVTAQCARCRKNYSFHFSAYRNGIAKIGQNPSPADIVSQDTLRFRGELDDLDIGELEHATRMFSLGIGVGAFVYLRRIFERLLDRHHAHFVAANGPIEGYEDKMRWEERVLALASALPKEVVENRKVYAILSVGIHELQEAECLLYYPALRAVIVDILEQDIAAKQRAKSAEALRHAVDDIAGKLRPS